MATVIDTGPSGWDVASQSFQRAFEMGQQLYQQQQELEQRKIEAQSRMDLEAAERKKLLDQIDQEHQSSALSSQALSVLQGNLGNMADGMRFGSAVSKLAPELFGRVLRLRDNFLGQQRDALAVSQAADAASNLSRVLSNISSPAQREAVKGLVALGQAGANVPQSVIQSVYPQLTPPPPPPNPADRIQALNGMRGLMEHGSTLGEARRVYSIGPISGVSDEYKLPAMTSGQRGASMQAMKNAGLQNLMETQFPLVQGLTEQTGGLTLPTAFYAQLRKVGYQAAVNEITDPAQRQLVNATRKFVDAQRYFLSGQQTSDQEFANQLSYTAIFAADDPQTRQQKIAGMLATIDAVRATTVGVASPSQAVGRMLDQARKQGWAPRVVQALERQHRDAKAWEDANARSPQIIFPPTPIDSLDVDADTTWIRTHIQ